MIGLEEPAIYLLFGVLLHRPVVACVRCCEHDFELSREVGRRPGVCQAFGFDALE